MSEYPASELVIKPPDFSRVPDFRVRAHVPGIRVSYINYLILGEYPTLRLGHVSDYPASELVIRLPDFRIPRFRVPHFRVRVRVRVSGIRVIRLPDFRRVPGVRVRFRVFGIRVSYQATQFQDTPIQST